MPAAAGGGRAARGACMLACMHACWARVARGHAAAMARVGTGPVAPRHSRPQGRPHGASGLLPVPRLCMPPGAGAAASPRAVTLSHPHAAITARHHAAPAHPQSAARCCRSDARHARGAPRRCLPPPFCDRHGRPRHRRRCCCCCCYCCTVARCSLLLDARHSRQPLPHRLLASGSGSSTTELSGSSMRVPLSSQERGCWGAQCPQRSRCENQRSSRGGGERH